MLLFPQRGGPRRGWGRGAQTHIILSCTCVAHVGAPDSPRSSTCSPNLALPAPSSQRPAPRSCSPPAAANRRRLTPPTPLRRQPPPARSTSTPRASPARSEAHTSELQSLMRISYAVLCLNKKNKQPTIPTQQHN